MHPVDLKRRFGYIYQPFEVSFTRVRVLSIWQTAQFVSVICSLFWRRTFTILKNLCTLKRAYHNGFSRCTLFWNQWIFCPFSGKWKVWNNEISNKCKPWACLRPKVILKVFSSGIPIVKRLVFKRNFAFQTWLGVTATYNGFRLNVVKPKQKSQITLTNHNRRVQRYESIRIRNKYKLAVHDCFNSGFPLVEKLAWALPTNHRAQ